MAKNSAANLLTSVDSLFTTQAERDEAQRETVIDIPLVEISDFPNHPFKVRMDDSMMQMVESVERYGVLVPALVRQKPDGGYEMVAGHRRKKASELAEKATLSCIVRELTDEEATIIMVDSNLQREQILPSEKAFAYKMKLEAMRRQQGSRTDLTSAPVEKIGARLIHVSTDYVFPGTANGGVALDECAVPAPISAYGQTKLLGEQYVERFCRRHFIVRTAWLYSYYGKNFVKTMIRLGRTHDKITVVNDQLGNPTNAVDLAYHILKLAVSHDYGIYHCTGNGEGI